jgi:uncharacterized protein (DUF1330 family)
MPAYVIAEHDVHDPVGYDKARPGAAAAIAVHGGRYLTNGLGKAELIEGTAPPKRMVLLEFPDMESARRFYESHEYREARTTRQAASHSRLILVEGVNLK